MNVLSQAPNVPPGLYGATAFQIVNNLLVMLAKKQVITSADRADLLHTIASGMQPANDPHIVAMKAFLRSLASLNPMTQ